MSGDDTTTTAPAQELSNVVRERWKPLFGVSLTSVSGGLAEALFLVVVVQVIFAITDDTGVVELVGGVELEISTTLAICVGLLVFRLAMASLTSYQSATIMNGAVASSRRRLIRAYFSAAWGTQQDQNAGVLQDLATARSNNVLSYLGGITAMITAIGNLAAMMVVAIVLDPVGAVVLLVAVGIFGSLLRPLRKAVGRRSKRATAARVAFATSLNEYSQLALELRVFHTTDTAVRKVDRLIENNRRASVRFSFLSGMMSPIYSGLAYGVLLVVLVIIWFSGAGDLAALGAVMLVVLRSLSYGQALQGALTSLSANRPVAEELFEQILELEENRHFTGTAPVAAIPHVVVDGVRFEYDHGTPVLHDISFSIDRHEIVGIVGPSGSGKSTLVQLLLGLRHPQHGSIRVGDQEVADIDRQEWARMVTFVPQAPGFLSASIEDNIRFLRDGVSEEQVREAAALANIDEEIARMPGGYDRPVGEKGGHLSGGQQQRLCIARALIEKPELMILDEPSSALDVRSEHLLRTTLLGLRDRMAVIVIAHRLSTLDICDRIMVIQEGRMVGFDTPQRLAETNQFYRRALELSGLR